MAKLSFTLFTVLFLLACTYAPRTIAATDMKDKTDVRIWKCVVQLMETDMKACDKMKLEAMMVKGHSKKSHDYIQECCNGFRKLDQDCPCLLMEKSLGAAEGKERKQFKRLIQIVNSQCGLKRRCNTGK